MVGSLHGRDAEVHYENISCCPKYHPCPTCGRHGRRKEHLNRQVRTIAYGKIVYLDINYAEYRATCQCCKTFRSTPEGVEAGDRYDCKVRQAVLDRLTGDGMNVQTLLAALHRDFLLDLSEGFVYECLHREVARLEMSDYRQWALERFSGTLCVDELHLGRYTLLLATDPWNDFPVAFALVDKNDQDHMRRFLENLKNRGFSPEVVVTDGSTLYPTVLAELWPKAQHQLCLFHVMQDITDVILDAVKRLRREMARRGNRGRRRRRGRPGKGQKKSAKTTLKDKASYVFKNRYLIVKRRENMSEDDRKNLETMLSYLPALGPLRLCMDKIFDLFSGDQTRQQAGCRRNALIRNESFQEIPEFAKIVKMLDPEKFEKIVAFLHSEAGKQVRTNNHVERANRKLRYLEKSRYKWRRRRNIVRFILLAIQCWWCQRSDYPGPSPRQLARNTQKHAKSTPISTYALSG